jgi:hypothetical protein
MFVLALAGHDFVANDDQSKVRGHDAGSGQMKVNKGVKSRAEDRHRSRRF